MDRGVCRECGCSDERACDGGCIWVEADLCSRCYRDLGGAERGGLLLPGMDADEDDFEFEED